MSRSVTAQSSLSQSLAVFVRAVLLSLLAFGAFAPAANAQFKHVRAQVVAPQLASTSTICDTSAFPPFNRKGPWSFALCDDADERVMTCYISATKLAQDKLPPAMLRRALLRMMEEYEQGEGLPAAMAGALNLDCAPEVTSF